MKEELETAVYDEDFSPSSSVNLYLNDIGNISLLTPEEEQSIGRRIKDGDKEARKELILANLKFVVTVAKRYQNRGIDLLDLIEAGNEGLIKATSRFDPDLGYRFTTIAYWWIKVSIEKYILSNNRTVRISNGYQKNIDAYRREVALLEKTLNHTPSLKEIQDNTKYSIEEIRDFNLYHQENISLNQMINDDESSSLEEYVLAEDPEEEIIERLDQETLYKILLNTLDEQELFVIIYRMGFLNKERKTLEQLAPYFKVTRERIRQIETKAFKNLRNSRDFKNFYQNTGRVKLIPHYSKHTILNMLSLKKNSNIGKAIKSLSTEEQNLLHKRYNSDLTKVINNDITLQEFCYIYDVILPKLQKYLNEELVPENNPYLDNLVSLWGIDILDELYPLLTKDELHTLITEDKLGKRAKIPIHKYLATKINSCNFKSFFKDTPKSVIAMVCNSLSLKERNVLINTWGNDYLTTEENGHTTEYIVDSVIKVLIKVKELATHKISFWNFFISTDKSTSFRKIRIDKALTYLSAEELSILKETFGPSYQTLLDVPESTVEKAYNIIMKIKRGIILYPEFQNIYPLKHFFPETSDEELANAITELSFKSQELLHYYFGDNLNRGVFVYDPEIKQVLDSITSVLCMQKRIIISNFGDIVASPLNEELKYVLYNLNDEEKELLKLGLGSDYIFKPNIYFLYPKKRKEFFALIEKIKKDLEKTPLVETPSLTEIEEDPKFQKIYTYLLNFMKSDYALIMTLYFKSYKYQEFSYQEIASLLNMDALEVSLKIKEGLDWLKTCHINYNNLSLRLTID